MSALRVYAEPPLLDEGAVTDNNPLPLVSEIFSMEQRPSKGSLNFRVGEKLEPIAFGGGVVASGLFFHASSLPAPWSEQFKGNHILQIFLGNAAGKAPTVIPQFGSILLVTPKIPSKKVIFKVGLPTGSVKNQAVVLFSSPGTPREQPQEERLKNSFFSKTGSAELLPVGKPEKLEVKTTTGRYAFRQQAMRLTLLADLVTPFNPIDASLKGEVTVPVFWPGGKNSELLVKRLAARGLSQLAQNPTQMPDALPAPREVAGTKPTPSSEKPESPQAAPEAPLEGQTAPQIDPHAK